MLPEIGQVALILALLIACLQTVLPLLGAHQFQRHPGAEAAGALMAVARPAAFLQLLLVLIAFGLLTWAFVHSDFSVAYVATNSNTRLPMVFRYTAVWSSHEGSLLLWALILSLWTAMVALFSRHLPQQVAARVLAVMGLIAVGFLAFLIFTSNPFERLVPVPPEGNDMNPLLQDPGMIVHPPMLYLGYVGFSVPFAFAIAAMLEGRVDARWLRWTRPWTNIAWSFLTLGIALGSWWAYYELGWGGWWFWDPVENASFMPWLVGAALIHSEAVTEKRGSFSGWTLLLAISAFSLSLLGTFLVRSGVLTSVHAFAADPTRGLFILVFLGIIVGGSLLLYALRVQGTQAPDEGKPFTAVSRETTLLINNLLLVAACGMVLLGTLYPLLADALGMGKISVGPPYFGVLFLLLMAPLVLLVPFGPLTRWQRDQPSRMLRLLLPWLIPSGALGIAAFAMAPQGGWKTAAGVAAAAWVALGTLRFVYSRLRPANGGKGRLTAEMWGMTLAHLGIAVFLVGALLTEALSTQRELALSPGQSVEAGGYSFRFDGAEHHEGPNYISDRGTVTVLRDGVPLRTLHPEKRRYLAGGQVMTEAALAPGFTHDLYVALGEPLGDAPPGSTAASSWAVRVHIKPFVRWIWLGAILMTLGGVVTATDRRFRTRKPMNEASA